MATNAVLLLACFHWYGCWWCRGCSQCKSQNKKVAICVSEDVALKWGLKFPGWPAGFSCTMAPLSQTVKSCGHYTGAFHGRSAHPHSLFYYPDASCVCCQFNKWEKWHSHIFSTLDSGSRANWPMYQQWLITLVTCFDTCMHRNNNKESVFK